MIFGALAKPFAVPIMSLSFLSTKVLTSLVLKYDVKTIKESLDDDL